VPYEYLEDGVTSDLTLHAWAPSLDELFAAAADGAVNVMIESLDAIRPGLARPVSLEAAALDLLLVRFLDEIFFLKDAEGLFVRATDVHVEGAPGAFRLRGMLRGEPIDRSRHPLAGDVKAATVHGLRVEPCPSGWEATVTLDV
jgi:SHS2 domain-containing protein